MPTGGVQSLLSTYGSSGPQSTEPNMSRPVDITQQADYRSLQRRYQQPIVSAPNPNTRSRNLTSPITPFNPQMSSPRNLPAESRNYVPSAQRTTPLGNPIPGSAQAEPAPQVVPQRVAPRSTFDIGAFQKRYSKPASPRSEAQQQSPPPTVSSVPSDLAKFMEETKRPTSADQDLEVEVSESGPTVSVAQEIHQSLTMPNVQGEATRNTAQQQEPGEVSTEDQDTREEDIEQ